MNLLSPAFRPQNVIELNGVTKRYGRQLALNNVTISIGTGVSGLLGPNGSGKSTLIKSLLGLVKIQSGSATVLGLSLPQQVQVIRDCVGYLPEDDCFIAGLTGIESVQFMARLSGISSIEALRRSHEVMDYAEFGQERYRHVETYSTGMRQKLKFAQAIVHDPQLLILDEPTSGLDPEQRASMLRKIRNLAENHGKSILICTHILHDVRTVCDQVIIMARGAIRLSDSLENLSRPTNGGMFVRVGNQRPTTATEQFPDAGRLVERLRQVSIAAELRGNGVVWVPALGDGSRKAIWEAAAISGVFIEGLDGARNSLEEVFFEAVKEAAHGSA